MEEIKEKKLLALDDFEIALNELIASFEKVSECLLSLAVNDLKQQYLTTGSCKLPELINTYCNKEQPYHYIRDMRADRCQLFSRPALGISPPVLAA